jgi:hypothetical protein
MSYRHGYAPRSGYHPLYSVYSSMMTRCYNPNRSAFKYYGGRGIAVCKQWRHKPEAFIEWAMQNGWKPGLTIERKNNDGNYTPSNCVWATIRQQNRNSRNAKLTANDVKYIKTLLANGQLQRDIGHAFGVSQQTVSAIKHGESWLDI